MMSLTLKRHYPLLLAVLAVVTALLVGIPNTRIIAYTVPGRQPASDDVLNVTNATDLFDEGRIHEISILITEENREQMVTTYRETGAKDYFPADLILDGVRINNVGIRLKGNASLRNLGGGGDWPGGGGPPQFPGDGQPPQFPGGGAQPPRLPGNRPTQPNDGQNPPLPPGGAGQTEPPRVGNGDAALGDTSGHVSYLIKFDEYVAGQAYQGRAKIALRAYGISYDAAQLQEPVTNAAFNAVGVTSVKTAYISLQFNSDAPRLYAVTEELNQDYIDRIFPAADGVLYKVQQVGNDFRYLGEDPTRYAAIFSQETAKNDADFAPLIAFIRFVNEADDEEFARDLPRWFDVDAFAAYLAANNLLVNYDSLPGMGNNYYLYYNFDTARFTILAWDTNESLGGLGGGQSAALDLYWQALRDRFGALFDADGATTASPAAGLPAADRRGGALGGPMGGNHLLLTRFFATPEFVALYKEKLQAFYDRLFVAGFLTDRIDAYAALVTAYNQEHPLVEPAAYDAAVQETRNFIQQRETYLQTTELLGP